MNLVFDDILFVPLIAQRFMNIYIGVKDNHEVLNHQGFSEFRRSAHIFVWSSGLAKSPVSV